MRSYRCLQAMRYNWELLPPPKARKLDFFISSFRVQKQEMIPHVTLAGEQVVQADPLTQKDPGNMTVRDNNHL